jgi:hypothetical protein
VLRIQRLRSPAQLWRIARRAIRGTGDWRDGLLAFTRLAELRTKAYADSAARLRARIERSEVNPFPENPGLKPDDVVPSLQAILLERRRAVQGDSAVLADILPGFPPNSTTTGTPGSWDGWARAPRIRSPAGFSRPTPPSSRSATSRCSRTSPIPS